jgi:hypothetical protein
MRGRLLTACLALLLATPVLASMEDDGAWAAGVWAVTAWSEGAWLEGDAPGSTVPDCTSSPTDEADCVSDIEGAGLSASVVERCSDAAVGVVVSTAPPAGTEVTAGSTVVVRVSTGVACVPGDGQGSRLGIGLSIGIN